jgi:hypothetical protein
MGKPAVGLRRRHLTSIPHPGPDPDPAWRWVGSEVQTTMALLEPELARAIRLSLPATARGGELARRLETPIAAVVGRVHRGRLRLRRILRDWFAPPARQPLRLAR